MKGRGAEVWLNVVACLLCRFWGDGAAWSAPVCTSPARLIWGSWEGWLSTANGPHKHWEGPALAYHWCRPISLQGPRENVVGLGEGIVDQGTGRPVSRLIVGEKGEWEETEKSPPGRWFLGKKKQVRTERKEKGKKNTPFHWQKACLPAQTMNAPSYLLSERPLCSLSPSRSHPSFLSPHPFIVCPMISLSFHPSFMDSWMWGQ